MGTLADNTVVPGTTAALQTRHEPVTSRRGRIVLAGVIVLYVLVLLRTAWLCDDAYITFRTVYNFVHGYGLS